jgi:cytochrome c-type biogenesis protein CcmH
MSGINLNSVSVWVFIAVAVALACALGASLYWASAGKAGNAPRGQRLWLALAAPLLVAALYVLRGEPGAIAPPSHETRLDMAQMKAAMEKLASRLKEHPEDLDGWLMLARSYTVIGRYAEAADAYEHAQARVMENGDLLVNWIELRLMLNNRKFDARTQELLERAAQVAPDSSDVLLLRALAAHDRGDTAASDALISQLHERFAPGSKERQDIDKALDSWMKRGDAPATEQAQTAAPSADSPAAAGAPDPKVMVQRLADRLKEHPEDTDGWLRLARSYAVLGRPAEANDAFEHAQTQAMQDPGMLAIWIEMRWRMNNGKFDARTQELLEHATTLAPDNPDLLLLRALAANDRGDKAGAAALVATLRGHFPPGSSEREELDATIEKLMPPGERPGGKKDPVTSP